MVRIYTDIKRFVKILFALIILSLACSISYGQSYIWQGSTNQFTGQLGGLGSNKWFLLPNDTLKFTSALREDGLLAYKLGTVYVYDSAGCSCYKALATAAGATYTAGYGLVLVANQFSVDTAQIVTQFDLSQETWQTTLLRDNNTDVKPFIRQGASTALAPAMLSIKRRTTALPYIHLIDSSNSDGFLKIYSQKAGGTALSFQASQAFIIEDSTGVPTGALSRETRVSHLIRNKNFDSAGVTWGFLDAGNNLIAFTGIDVTGRFASYTQRDNNGTSDIRGFARSGKGIMGGVTSAWTFESLDSTWRLYSINNFPMNSFNLIDTSFFFGDITRQPEIGIGLNTAKPISIKTVNDYSSGGYTYLVRNATSPFAIEKRSTIPYSDLTGTPTIPTISGTNNTVVKFTSSSTIGNSNITDNGTIVAINSKATHTAGTLASGEKALAATATMPASPAGAAVAYDFTVTGNGSAAQNNRGMLFTYGAGYTGNAKSIAAEFDNFNASTGNDLQWTTFGTNPTGNSGLNAFAIGVTTGLNNAGYYEAYDGNLNVGLFGKSTKAKNSATNIGIIGQGNNTGSSPVHVGGWFTLAATAPTYTSAALVADNGATTSPIALFRDNGSTVASVTDGGTLNTQNVEPLTDDTYYLGENSSTTPHAYKGVILKDTTNGNYYRIEVVNGVITATAL